MPKGATVTMHYNGYLQDETLFDSSYTRGAPFKFKVGDGEVIKGWDQAVVQLKKRSKAKLIIPPELAYGASGIGDKVPPNATLTFFVEVFGFEEQQAEDGPSTQASSNPDVTRSTVGYYARE